MFQIVLVIAVGQFDRFSNHGCAVKIRVHHALPCIFRQFAVHKHQPVNILCDAVHF